MNANRDYEAVHAHRRIAREIMIETTSVRVRSGLCWLMLFAASCRGARGEPNEQAIDLQHAPEQQPIADPSETAELPAQLEGGIALTPKARYRIAARVLSSERYRRGWRADVSPIDLALGWSTMGDPEVDRWIDWSQSSRWYFWQWGAGSPYQNDAIRRQTANVHVVPANDNLRRALFDLDEGDLVELKGWLIDLEGPDRDRWRSSLSRTDKGNHSCELMFVTELADPETVYR
jgi:hypothetical protein